MHISLSVCLLSIAALNVALAQTYTTLATFNRSNGAYPSALLQGTDGNFYGTTFGGGAYNAGSVFKLSPSGELTSLHSFDFRYGNGPATPLTQALNGNFYGTTQGGGPGCGGYGCGAVFSITPSGVVTIVAVFSESNGRYPNGLIQASNGDFYGVAQAVGYPINSSCSGGCGTIFRVTAGGTLETMHAFDWTDGANPSGALVQSYYGDLYGVASMGGTHSDGTVFKISPGGALTTLHSFDGPDGSSPSYGVTEATDGKFYGVSLGGGNCSNFSCGSIFSITPGGDLTPICYFNSTGGFAPEGPLVEGTDGYFYGATAGGGASGCNGGCGTLFSVSPVGYLTTLFNFDGSTGTPAAGLIQGTDGDFYGVTSDGGPAASGTVFRLSTGLGPFVKTLPTAGPVGATVHILGTNLAAPASVTFNGTSAEVTSISPSQIVATVPAGATSGLVEVTTAGRTLSTGKVIFNVLP